MVGIPEDLIEKAQEVYRTVDQDPVHVIALALSAERDRCEAIAQGWQPIETAPKDGTIIDVWVDDPDGPHRQTNVIWNDGYWVLRRDIWSSVEAFFDENGIPKVRISHWMPLPPPPSEPHEPPSSQAP